MSDISVIVLPDGSELNVKDTVARNQMRQSAVYFGTNTITNSMLMITDGTDGKVKGASIKYYKPNESTQNKSEVTITPSLTFSGDSKTLSHEFTAEKITSDISFTPAGTITTVVTSVTTLNKTVVTGSAIKSVELNINDSTHNHNVSSSMVTAYATFTPSGEITLKTTNASTDTIYGISTFSKSAPTFSGTTATISTSSSVKFVTSVTAHSYTPQGTVESVIKSFGANTTPVYAYYTTGGEKLIISNCTINEGAPTFTGTLASLTHSTTTDTVSTSGTYVPAGTISSVITNITTVSKTFNKETSKINGATFAGTMGDVTATSTVKFATSIIEATTRPSITLSTTSATTASVTVINSVTTGRPTFSGTTQTATATANKSVIVSISNHTFTPGGTISGTVKVPAHNHGITTNKTNVLIE